MSPDTNCAYCGRSVGADPNFVRMGVWEAMAFVHWPSFGKLRQERKAQRQPA
jgi:hypothetical protein